jgi:uncharacterized tellurite resistance protein B-like protein
MFESFRRFLSDVTEGEKPPTHFEHNDYRLAAAALLVHAAAIDGTVSDVERSKLHALIKRQFGLDEELTDELVAEATAASMRRSISTISRSGSIARSKRTVAAAWSK